MLDDDSASLDDPEERPNILWVYPVFYRKEDPENKFAMTNIFWVSDWDSHFMNAPPDPVKTAQIIKVVERAKILQQLGIEWAQNEYFYIRDVEDTPLIVAKFNAVGLPPMEAYIVSGPIHDAKLVEFKMVTIN